MIRRGRAPRSSTSALAEPRVAGEPAAEPALNHQPGTHPAARPPQRREPPGPSVTHSHADFDESLVSPDGASVYVADLGGNNVTVIDAVTGRGVAAVGVGNAPFDIAITPDGLAAYVVNVSGTVSVIDTATNAVTATIEAGTGADGVAISSDGSAAYVADSNENSLSVVSTASNTVTGTVTGFNAPLGIAVLATTAAPVVTGISPASGPVGGGTTITITGSGLTAATAVDFGTVPAASFTVTSDTSITASTPAASAGQVDVTIATPAGTSMTSSADQYSYIYLFAGFLPPVAVPPTVNSVTAGQAIPVKFSLGSNQGLKILTAGYPTVQQVNCSDNTPIGTATEASTAGGGGLQYDPSADTYTFVWKTSKAFKSTCQVFTLGLNDATQRTADFDFKH
jgi:YVTN family beta-propeller protein